MAGETVKSSAVCLRIAPWSRTSHIVTWLTPHGVVPCVVKGAERPKSLFLGAYDLNYTCDILYYARPSGGELHALRECSPVALREHLRGNYRLLMLAEYFRFLSLHMTPSGGEAAAWFAMLTKSLDSLENLAQAPVNARELIAALLAFELEALDLAGLKPNFSGYDPDAEWSYFSLENGVFGGLGRGIRIMTDVAAYLNAPQSEPKKSTTPLDAARVIGVFYQFHVDCTADVRRAVLRMISQT